MADKITPARRSWNMAQIRGKNTKPELLVRKFLFSQYVRYRIHTTLPGRPDIVISKKKIAIFVNGCFWHGWHFKQWRDRLPKEYWVEKIERNIRRDTQKFRTLRSMDYKVVRIWEHTLKSNPLEFCI